ERGEVGLGLLVAPTHETADGRPQTAEGARVCCLLSAVCCLAIKLLELGPVRSQLPALLSHHVGRSLVDEALVRQLALGARDLVAKPRHPLAHPPFHLRAVDIRRAEDLERPDRGKRLALRSVEREAGEPSDELEGLAIARDPGR